MVHDDVKFKLMKLKARDIPVLMRIGKQGLTESAVNEVQKQLKAKKLIKIKFLRASFEEPEEKNSLIEMLLNKTSSVLIEKRGNTAVIYKG